MRTYLVIKRVFMTGLLVLIPWSAALITHAADQSNPGIPEVMAEQPIPHAVPVAEVPPEQATWVGDIRNSLDIYKKNYPASDFDPYLKKLNLVGDAVNRGDRRVVKVEMSAFFKMLAKRAYGINEGAADELSNFAQMVTPVQEYGISVPRSGSDQYGSELSGSGSPQ